MGCGLRDAQATLIRIVSADGALTVARGRRRQGRSGYLHRDEECYNRFAARKGSLKSLRRTIERPARQALIAELRLPDSGVVRG
jgi:predicted RNA-binding protein YlxR (DUF448 family)